MALSSSASALLEAIGLTDFLQISWAYASSDATTYSPAFSIGENNNNGFDVSLKGAQSSGPPPGDISVTFPGADGNYNTRLTTTGGAIVGGTPLMLAVWYTTADATLRFSINNGTVFSLVNTNGIGDADPTNTAAFNSYCAGDGFVQQGPSFLWQGAEGVANALAHLPHLFTEKLQFSDFS
jgi:hypothetical protein